MMKCFRLLPASEGRRREFKITLGLRTGYRPAGRIYDLEEAVRAAHRGDVVVIAGKGHEPGQTAAGMTVPFDDRVVAREELEARA